VRDSVDAHLGRIAVASLLSGALSVAANAAEDDESDHVTESVGNAAAQEAARVGGRIVDRELNVRPTLRIRAGAPIRVLVSQDIVLRPYPQ
jgi:type IV secretion system protein VirB10